MNLSRRQMLKLTAGTAAALAAGARLPAVAAAAKKIPIGLGLWSVRQQCEKDLPGVLKAIGEMGYDGVEFAHSYYGHEAPAIRKLLDDNGLACCGMHMGLPMLDGEAFDATVKIHKTLGTPYLIIASLPRRNTESVQALVETGKKFNALSKKLADHGMKIGYHCHGGDFEPVEGKIPWVVFGENTDPEVILQLDIGNAIGGGGDAIAMLKHFPGRSISVHLKEHGGPAGAVIGEGDVNWKEVFQICESTGGTKWYVVEDETREGPESIEAVRRCLQSLRKMGK